MLVHEDFPYEHDEESRSQWYATLVEGIQWYDCEEMMILYELVCYMEDEPIVWTLYFDGSKCSYEVGEGIILVSPTNEVIPMAYKPRFDYINNMAKYEALILGLKDAMLLKEKKIKIFLDS